MTQAQIQLSPEERRFCDLLNGFSRTLSPPVECRIAGGWVRDKLLALPSHDLDIALPLASGYTFATDFVEYIRNTTPAGGEGAISLSSVGKVAANPEQSKHLETGTTRIMGLECDFVGLRSETYTDSRIPDQVRLGTPEEDAVRRDLTINALFYNIATETIEDFTQRGLSDLEARVARTPLPPRQTFLDDPLRVLRTIRFAGRYNLRVEQEVADAARDAEIQVSYLWIAALRTKVSKERIGIEITKTFAKSPLDSLHLIQDLGLHSSIFTCPGIPESQEPAADTRGSAVTAARAVEQVRQRWPEMRDVPGLENVWLGAALQPYEGLVVVGKKEVPAVSVCVAEGLKLSTEINRAVTSLFTAQTLLASVLESQSRSAIGLVLQNPAVKPWRRSVLWSASRAVAALGVGIDEHKWNETAEQELQRWRAFVRKVDELGLEGEIDAPLLVDGKTVLPLLQIKPSPVLQVILHHIRVFQLDHPQAIKADVEAWVKEQWEDEATRTKWEGMAPQPVVSAKNKKRKGAAA